MRHSRDRGECLTRAKPVVDLLKISRIYYSVGSGGGIKPSQTPFMMFFEIVASPLRGTLKLSTAQSSPEQVNQQCQNHTDDHHGRYGYEYHPALSLDAYITRQSAKPAESPGCEL